MRIDNNKLGVVLAQRNMRRNDLARLLGISQTALSLQCHQENLRPYSAAKIAAALNIDPRYIIEGGESLPDAVSGTTAAPAAPPKPKRDPKPKPPAEPPAPWKTDYEVYRAETLAAIREISKDEAWIKKLEQYHPTANVPLSIERSFNTFWGTEEGWENKRKSKSNHINWRATMDRTLQYSIVPKAGERRRYE